METYGADKIKKFYAGEETDILYGMSINELETEYKNYINNLGFEYNESIAKTYFARKALIKKICPRYTANRLQEAYEFYEAESYMGAMRIYKEIFNYTKSYYALLGLTSCMNKVSEPGDALQLLKENIPLYKKTAYNNNLLIRLGDYSGMIQRNDSAKYYYDLLVNENPVYHYQCAVSIRKELLAENEYSLRNYIEAGNRKRFEIVMNKLKERMDYYLIPVAISLSKSSVNDYMLFMAYFVNKVEIESEIAFFAILQLGKYAIENSDYETAKFLFGKDFKYNNERSSEIIKGQYLRLSEWLSINNSQNYQE